MRFHPSARNVWAVVLFADGTRGSGPTDCWGRDLDSESDSGRPCSEQRLLSPLMTGADRRSRRGESDRAYDDRVLRGGTGRSAANVLADERHRCDREVSAAVDAGDA